MPSVNLIFLLKYWLFELVLLIELLTESVIWLYNCWYSSKAWLKLFFKVVILFCCAGVICACNKTSLDCWDVFVFESVWREKPSIPFTFWFCFVQMSQRRSRITLLNSKRGQQQQLSFWVFEQLFGLIYSQTAHINFSVWVVIL